MNSNRPIFLKLSPKFERNLNSGEYNFYSNQNNEIFTTKDIIRIIDPSIDSTFKYLFEEKRKKMLEDMLNSLLFPDYPYLIIEAILNNEIVLENKLHDKGSIKSDLVCKAKINGTIIIFGIEMQIGIVGDFSRRLFKYSIGLSYKYDFVNSWINAFFINLNQGPKYSKIIKFKENINGEEKELEYITINEIDLKEEIKKINNGEEVFINGKKINGKGKEWLKLLGLRTWCPKENGKYILPKDYTLSNNEFFNEAINVLGNIPLLVEIDLDEFENEKTKFNKKINEMVEEGIEQGREEGKIMSAYILFKEKCDKDFVLKIFGNKRLHSNNVVDCLENEDEETVVDFILFLNRNNFLIIDK